MKKMLCVLVPMLFVLPAFAAHKYRIPVYEYVFAEVDPLTEKAFFGVYIRNHLYKVTAIRIDRGGIYFLKGDKLHKKVDQYNQDIE